MILFIKTIIVIFYIVVPSSCISVDKFLNKNQFDTITQQVVDVLLSCEYRKKFDFLTVLTDGEKGIRLPSKLFDVYSTLQVKGLILNDTIVKIPPNVFEHRIPQKPDIVLAIVSSPLTLQHFFMQIKKSNLWNLASFYVIIDTESLEKNCKRAYDFLRISWKNDILMSTLFCINSSNEILIYTYNPYTNVAPKEWQEVSEEFNDKKSFNDTWILYKRKLINNQTKCWEVDFVKDLTTGGHKIRAMVLPIPPTLVIHRNKTGWAQFEGLDAMISRVLLTKINASLEVTIIDDTSKKYSYSTLKKTLDRHLLDTLDSGEYDILLNAQYMFNRPPNTSFTYPHADAGVSVLTRSAGFETGPSKILHFMNHKLIFGLCLVFIATVLILGILDGEGIISASLEMLRIATGAGVFRMPGRIPLRIYLITVILLFLITGSTFQSSLSSILTSPVALPNIDGEEELLDSTYTIYVFHDYKNAVPQENTESRMVITGHWNCSKYVIEEEDTACIAERSRLLKISFDHNLHVSKHRLMNVPQGFMVRPNWPLKARLSNLLKCMMQCGLIEYWFSTTIWVYKPQWLLKQRNLKSSGYRSMTVSDLYFAFYILLFGLAASILVFLIELLTWKKFTGKSKKRRVDLPPLFEYAE